MKVTSYDGAQIQDILTGIITNPQVLGKVASRWDGQMFDSPAANLLTSLSVRYWNRHSTAPGCDIQKMVTAALGKRPREDNQVREIETLLSYLSDRYERAEEVNAGFVLDQTLEYFNKVRLNRMIESAQGLIANGKVADALTTVSEFQRVDTGTSSTVRLLNDEEAVRSCFRYNTDVLLEYPGALGRFYQDVFQRDALISYLAGEKVGKCVSEDMRVVLADGRVRSIGWMVSNKCRTPIMSFNEKTQRFDPIVVSEFWSNGVKECIKVTTRMGREVVTTHNHQYLTPDGWKMLQDIKVGDYIAVPKKLPVFGNRPLPESHIKFLAYMLAEGCCLGTQLNFTNTDPELIADFAETCDQLGFSHRRKKLATYISRTRWIRNRYPTALGKVSSKTKLIPGEIFECPKEQIALFLRIFFSCDGHIAKDSKLIEVGLANRKMLRQIGHLLTRFGIVYTFHYHPVRRDGKIFKAWRITIHDEENISLFIREINFLTYKQRVPSTGSSHLKSFLDKFPPVVAQRFMSDLAAEIKDTVPARSIKLKGKGRCLRSGYAFRRVVKNSQAIRAQIKKDLPIIRKSFRHAEGTESYDRYMNSEIVWDTVTSIKAVGKRRTYDLTVPENHNFVANDFIVHNSHWLMDVVWRAVLQRRKVFFFESGDMSFHQHAKRLLSRITGHPYRNPGRRWPYEVKVPTGIGKEGRDGEKVVPPEVFWETQVFEEPLDASRAWEGCKRAVRRLIKSDQDYLLMQYHPNSTLKVKDIETTLMEHAREGFVADLVVIDYADILALPGGRMEMRDQINTNWKMLRALSQKLHCCVVTATQADAASYDTWLLNRRNFSEDKRKLSHVHAMFGINCTASERKQGLYRLNTVVGRDLDWSWKQYVYTASCLSIGNPAVVSAFPERGGRTDSEEGD